MIVSKQRQAMRLRDELVREGWEDVTRGKHYKLRHPVYGVFVFSQSPSCVWWERNARGQLARLKRDAHINRR